MKNENEIATDTTSLDEKEAFLAAFLALRNAKKASYRKERKALLASADHSRHSHGSPVDWRDRIDGRFPPTSDFASAELSKLAAKATRKAAKTELEEDHRAAADAHRRAGAERAARWHEKKIELMTVKSA